MNGEPPTVQADRRRIVNAWCMYDWANSAFMTVVTTALFPVFFRSVAINAGLHDNDATAYWGYTSSIALLLVAAIAPLLGATADHTGGKKRYLGAFAAFGILFTASLVVIGENTWFLAAVLYVLAALGFSGGNVFYDSLLPHVARGGDIDRVSARGFALGYLGGGILLALNVLWIRRPQAFGMPDAAFAFRASFLSVAAWWAGFSIPFFRRVPEPPVVRRPDAARAPLTEGLRRLAATFHDIRRYRHLGLFLLAYWVYTDGIGTIFRMATAYGDEIGLKVTDMITALILIQATAIPFTFLFGRLAQVIGAKRSILLSLAVYGAVSVSAYFMTTAVHFYVLALAIATVQGGSQALSRSLFGRMVPRHKTAEFFGFYSTSSKFAGVFGPLIFGIISQAAGGSRLSILSIIAFFIVGAALLARVDVEAGIRAARQEV
jgi:UMF1 family MFS transporter